MIAFFLFFLFLGRFGIFKTFLRVMNVVKTLIQVLLIFFSGKSPKILMQLGILHFLSSIEIHLQKVTQIALSKYGLEMERKIFRF